MYTVFVGLDFLRIRVATVAQMIRLTLTVFKWRCFNVKGQGRLSPTRWCVTSDVTVLMVQMKVSVYIQVINMGLGKYIILFRPKIKLAFRKCQLHVFVGRKSRHIVNIGMKNVASFLKRLSSRKHTRLLGRRGHSLSQHTQFLKNNMIAENDFFYETLIQSSGPTRWHLARFARARFTLRAHENFRKKSVSQSTRNALKRIQKFLPL